MASVLDMCPCTARDFAKIHAIPYRIEVCPKMLTCRDHVAMRRWSFCGRHGLNVCAGCFASHDSDLGKEFLNLCYALHRYFICDIRFVIDFAVFCTERRDQSKAQQEMLNIFCQPTANRAI